MEDIMRDRTLAVILTVAVVILLGFPGLAFLCLGLTDFIVFYGFNNPFSVTAGFSNIIGVLGLCIGLFLIIITILAGFFMLRRKAGLPAPIPVVPAPPLSPDEPIPPSI
jgi:hypothetical protein